MKARAAAVLLGILLLVTACDDPLARSVMTLTFDKPARTVGVSVLSGEKHLRRYHGDDVLRLAEDVLAGRDEWGVRFARANPTDERVVFERRAGAISEIEQQATVDADNLRQLFLDVGVSMTFTRVEGTAELAFYPGASTRATRKEEETFRRDLDEFSHRAAAYFDAGRAFYRYLDANDARAEELFLALLADDGAPELEGLEPLTEKEQFLVGRFRHAIERLVETDPDHDVARLADLVFNPFPAVVDVRLPSEPVSLEGFVRTKSGTLRLETPQPTHALAGLEGRWLAPDPLAEVQRVDGASAKDLAIRLAHQPRKYAATAAPLEIAEALEEAMRPKARYEVRWVVQNDQ